MKELVNVQVMELPTIRFSSTSYFIIPLGSKYSSQRSVLKYPQATSFPRDRALHPYEATGNSLFIYILIFKFFDRRRDVKSF
jgi:hypothetical protein